MQSFEGFRGTLPKTRYTNRVFELIEIDQVVAEGVRPTNADCKMR